MLMSSFQGYCGSPTSDSTRNLLSMNANIALKPGQEIRYKFSDTEAQMVE